MIEVLQVKSLSPLVKDDFLYFIHLILMYYGIWLCNAVDKGMEGVHSEFH